MISFEPEYEKPECVDPGHDYEDGYCIKCGKLQPEILDEKAERLKLLCENVQLKEKIKAAHDLLLPLTKQVNPSVLVIRDVVFRLLR